MELLWAHCSLRTPKESLACLPHVHSNAVIDFSNIAANAADDLIYIPLVTITDRLLARRLYAE